MPFRKLIQKSFGKHDISNVRAYRDDRPETDQVSDAVATGRSAEPGTTTPASPATGPRGR